MLKNIFNLRVLSFLPRASYSMQIHLKDNRRLCSLYTFSPVMKIMDESNKAKLHSSYLLSCHDPKTVNKHLEITSSEPREELIVPGQIVKIWHESDMVKCYEIQIDHPAFDFKAGQWVDVFIPNIPTVGGFSICSAPHEFNQSRTIRLGVKKADWAPAAWFYNECTVGSKIDLRVGGDFYLDLEKDENLNRPILFIAGGVGVNPLYSMMLHAAKHPKKRGYMHMLYSAKSSSDLLYRSEFEKLCKTHKKMSVQFFCTKDSEVHNNLNITNGYITETSLASTLNYLCINVNSKGDIERFSYDEILTYMCGPPGMLEAMEKSLNKIGVPSKSIKYEKWW